MITFWWLFKPNLEQFVTFCNCFFDFISYPLIGWLFNRKDSQQCKFIYTFNDRVNNELHIIFSQFFPSICLTFWSSKNRKLNALCLFEFFVFLVIIWFEAVFLSKECSLVKWSKTVKWSLMVFGRVSVKTRSWVIMGSMKLLEVGVTLVGNLSCISKSYASNRATYVLSFRSSFNMSIIKSPKSNVSQANPSENATNSLDVPWSCWF